MTMEAAIETVIGTAYRNHRRNCIETAMETVIGTAYRNHAIEIL